MFARFGEASCDVNNKKGGKLWRKKGSDEKERGSGEKMTHYDSLAKKVAFVAKK